ncbi:MAG: hypothetical protein EXR55_06155 [Dehalococcoidia bacterium]|nr:hypothetical protein [Dehalococcoidia bacterium]
MIGRMIRAALLKVDLYEEVEADKSATVQALLVVVLVALATGIGGLQSGDPGALVAGVLVALGGWALWALITYLFGTTLFKTPETHADWGELARTMGFAQSVGVLKVFGIIPVVGNAVFVIVSLWQLVAVVLAIRQALDYRAMWRAVAVALVGFIVYVVLLVIFLAIFVGPA